MRIKKNLATADMIVRLTFSAVVIILFLLNVLSGPLAAGLLVLSGIFVITVIAGKRNRRVHVGGQHQIKKTNLSAK